MPTSLIQLFIKMMDIEQTNQSSKNHRNRVKVAIRVRPMIPKEIANNQASCIQYDNGKRVIIGKDRSYKFDHVFPETSPQKQIYHKCVKDLVISCFEGYNAAILAYGQTGSGKTFTMGTSPSLASEGDTDEHMAIIPRVIKEIFEIINQKKDSIQSIVKVSFIEIYNEQIIDLLSQDVIKMKNNKAPSSSTSIREEKDGSITLLGVTEERVSQSEETLNLLHRGGINRTTACTLMNDASSRSHGIFTIVIQQHNIQPNKGEGEDDGFIISKFYFVDLAGSERAKKTGASGSTLKEGININLGLLQLGNVISALSSTEKKQSQFITYRNSKLTRILQDCLGGNSNTYMIACISPADSNYEESLNTIKYAAKAMNIKNKPVINRDPHSAQINNLRQRILELELQNKSLRKAIQEGGIELNEEILVKRDCRADILTEQIKRLKNRIYSLEKDLQKSEHEEKGLKKKKNCLEIQNYEYKREIDKLRLIFDKLNSENQGIVNGYMEEYQNGGGVVEEYLQKIRELETEIYEHEKINNQLQDEYQRLKAQMEKDERILMKKNKIIRKLKTEIDELLLTKQMPQIQIQSNPGGELQKIDEEPDDEDDEEMDEDQNSLGDQHLQVAKEDYENCSSENTKKLKTVDKRIIEQEKILKGMNEEQIALEYELITEMKEQYHKKINSLEKQKQSLIKQQKQLAGYEKNPKLLPKIESLQIQLRELRKKSKEQFNLEKKVSLQNSEIKKLISELKQFKVQKIEINRKIKQDKMSYQKFKKERIREILKQKRENCRKDKQIRKLNLQNRKKSLLLVKKGKELQRIKKINQMVKNYHGKKKRVDENKRTSSNSQVNLSSQILNIIEDKFQQCLRKIVLQEQINWEISKYEQRIGELTKEIYDLENQEADLQLKVDRLQVGYSYFTIQNEIQGRQEGQEMDEMKRKQINDMNLALKELKDRVGDLHSNAKFCENRQRELADGIPNFDEAKDLFYSETLTSTSPQLTVEKCLFLLELTYSCLREILRENISLKIQKDNTLTQLQETKQILTQTETQKTTISMQYRQNLANLRQQMMLKYYAALEEHQNNMAALQAPQIAPSDQPSKYNNSFYSSNTSGRNEERERRNYQKKIVDLTKTNRQLSADVEMWRRKCGVIQQKYHNINVRFAKDKFIGLPMRNEENNNSSNTQNMLEEISTMIDKLDYRKKNIPRNDDENIDSNIENKNREEFNTNKWDCLKNLHAHSSPVASVVTYQNSFITAATKSIKIWDMERFQLVADLSNSGLNGFVKKVLCLPEQNLLVCACEKQIHLWDTRSFSSVGVLKSHKDEVRSLYSKKNMLFSAGKGSNGGGSLFLWDIRKLSQGIPLEEKQKNLDIFCMTTFDSILYYGTRTHQVRRMNFESLQILSPFEPPHMDTVTSLSVIGNMLVSGSKDKNLKLWSLESSTNNIRCTTHAFNDYVNTVETDRMFPLFYSGSRDGQIKVGTVAEGGEKIKFVGGIIAHTQSVNTICPLDNNGIFISGSSDRSIKVWKPCSSTLTHLYQEYRS